MAYIFTFVLLLALIAVLAIIVYNKIIKLKVRVKEGMADIQVQLKRRHNLIGNLVETVKGYASHEKETLEKVIQARNAAQQVAEQGSDIMAMQSAERMLSSALSGLKINALSEAYPDLKANTNFMQLQQELTDTEDKVAASRRFYNTTVQSYNTYIQQVPGNLFKGLAKAEKAEFFELEEDSEAKEVPQVNFKADTAAAQVTTPPIPKEAPKAEEVPSSPSPAATPAPAPEPKADTPEETSKEEKAEETPKSTPDLQAAAPPADYEVISKEAPAEEAIPTPVVEVKEEEAVVADQEAQSSEAPEEVKSENEEVKKEEEKAEPAPVESPAAEPAPEAPKTEETQSSETPEEEKKAE